MLHFKTIVIGFENLVKKSTLNLSNCIRIGGHMYMQNIHNVLKPHHLQSSRDYNSIVILIDCGIEMYKYMSDIYRFYV